MLNYLQDLWNVLPADMQEMLQLFGCVAIMAFIVIRFLIKPKKKAVAQIRIFSQNNIYAAIRKGMEDCDCMYELQDYYRAIHAYKREFPDKESQLDVKILLEKYNDNSTRLMSRFTKAY